MKKEKSYVFVDYQNQPVDFFVVLEELQKDYEINGVKAYWDWSKMSKLLATRYYSLGVELINLPEDGFPNGKKNDVKLVVDCVETLFNHPDIENYILITGDLDFFPLITKLKEYGKNVTIVARQKSISPHIKDIADKFIPYDNMAKKENENYKLEITDSDDFYKQVISYILEKGETVNYANVMRVIQNTKNKFAMNIETVGQRTMYYYHNKYNIEKKEQAYLKAYEHFLLRRLLEFGRSGANIEDLAKYLTDIQAWSPPTNISFMSFINKLKIERKIIEVKPNVYRVNPVYSWEFTVKGSKDYKDLGRKVIKEFFEIITKNNGEISLNDIMDMISTEISKKDLRFTLNLVKFTGLLVGPEGSDYVTFNIPVSLKEGITLEELQKETDKAFIKKIIKVYPLLEEELKDLAMYMFGDSNKLDKLKEELKELLSAGEIYLENETYNYKDPALEEIV